MPVRAARAVGLLVGAALVAGAASVPAATGSPSAPHVRASSPCSAGKVALTFDDGPATGPTGRLVRLLRGVRAPAVFFMVGQRVAAAPRLARHVERSGFLIANHSWAHADMTRQTASEVTATLRRTQRLLRRIGTHPTRLMRPPYGAIDETARAGIRAAGMIPVLWTIDSRDWAGGTATQIAERILRGLRRNGTNIVLQHDGVRHSPVSVEAVPIVVRRARRRGYCFVALDEAGRPGFPTPRASVRLSGGREGERGFATILLGKPAGRATSVRLRTRSGTARAGADFASVDRRVRIPAGRLRTRVPVRLLLDGKDEYAERFRVVIDRPRGLSVGTGAATAWIRDVDPRPRIGGRDVTVTEPTAGATTVRVRFRLTRASGKPVVVVLATRSGSATAADFTPVRSRFELAPGRVEVRLPVEVLADEADEGAEKFTVEVVRVRAARVGRVATVTIEPPPPSPAGRAAARAVSGEEVE